LREALFKANLALSCEECQRLGADGGAVRADRGVKPRRMRACGRARSVLEVAAGRADAFMDAGIGAPHTA
jgi:hypothetical protein